MSAHTRAGDELDRLRALVGAVPDPELPMVTIAELGVLRGVAREQSGALVVTITPTYSGCPAVEAIAARVAEVLRADGEAAAHVRVALAPAWTTDEMTASALRKLAEHGIAPPTGGGQPTAGAGAVLVPLAAPCPRCPRCDGDKVRELSRFGSTACKSLWFCPACAEPFEHFKRLA